MDSSLSRKRKHIQLLKAKSFEEFWPLYLEEHRHPFNRCFHCVGTLVGLSLVIVSFVMGPWYLFFLAYIVGYALSWIGHFFIEKNVPATFARPQWSFVADLKMTTLMLRGRMNSELQSAEAAEKS